MLYARSDVAAFSGVDDCPAGGHAEKADPNDEHFSVDCRECEAVLAHDPLWAPRPEEVPLTTVEAKKLEAEQHEANVGSAAMGLALQQLLREQMAKAPASAPAPEAAQPASTPAKARAPRSPGRTSAKPRT